MIPLASFIKLRFVLSLGSYTVASMMLITLFKALLRLVVCTAVTIVLLALLPGLPPYHEFKPLNAKPAVPLVGKLASNYVLDKAELLVEGKFVGAECILLDGNVLYAGVPSAEVVKVVDRGDSADVSFLGKTGSPCAWTMDSTENPSCSLPLGLRKDSQGQLVFADLHKGIIGFDLKTGNVKPYFEGPVQKNANDLDISKDGTIYYSIVFESSTDLLQQLLHPTGKLMKYDPKTKDTTTLISNLGFGNGVQLSENEDFVLINESLFGRTHRYYLKGPKAGTKDIFVDGLPGLPDNIRPNGRGGYVIPLFAGRIPLVDCLGQYPLALKVLARSRWILSKSMAFIKDSFGGWHYFDELENLINFYGPLGIDFHSEPQIVEVDSNGEILAVFRAKEKLTKPLTHMAIGEDFTYLGSFYENKIWKLRTSDLRNY